MQEKPLISIITVNLNDLEGLKKTMQSVFEQTWQKFEYIVIDGGSTDGSKEYIESNSDKIDYWISEKDSGIYNAMNKGIKVANGEYLLFLNSGDELYNPLVFEENKNLIHTEDLVYFDIFLIFPGHTKTHNYPGTLSFKTFMEGSIGHPTTFIKRSLFEKTGLYDEKLQIVADWKFFAVAVVKNKCSRRKVDAVLSKFYMDGISSINGKTVREERKRVMKTSFPFRSFFYQNKRKFNDFKFIQVCRTFFKKITDKIENRQILK